MQLLYKCKNTRRECNNFAFPTNINIAVPFSLLFGKQGIQVYRPNKKKIHYNADLHSQKVSFPIFKWLFRQFNFNFCLRQRKLASLIYKAAILIYLNKLKKISFYKKKRADFFFLIKRLLVKSHDLLPVDDYTC